MLSTARRPRSALLDGRRLTRTRNAHDLSNRADGRIVNARGAYGAGRPGQERFDGDIVAAYIGRTLLVRACLMWVRGGYNQIELEYTGSHEIGILRCDRLPVGSCHELGESDGSEQGEDDTRKSRCSLTDASRAVQRPMPSSIRLSRPSIAFLSGVHPRPYAPPAISGRTRTLNLPADESPIYSARATRHNA